MYMHEISLEINGILYAASYDVFDDTLNVTLPDGSQRQTELRGLKHETAALTHLRAYVLHEIPINVKMSENEISLSLIHI